MDMKKIIKAVAVSAPVIAAAVGVFDLAISKYQESKGDYSREFSEIENEIKSVIGKVREENEQKI